MVLLEIGINGRNLTKKTGCIIKSSSRENVHDRFRRIVDHNAINPS